MVQQIKARMSKIKIGKRENNKGKHFFWGVEIQFIGTCIYKSSHWKNLNVLEKTK